MAGEWIKMENSLGDKPEVWGIAARLDIDPDAVVGKLHRIWVWFDEQTENGNAPVVTKMLLDRRVGVNGFCDAVEAVGWMLNDGDVIQLPNFDRHNGKTAKNRALTAKRVARHKRKGNDDGNDKSNAASVTSALPREEKRRYIETPDGVSSAQSSNDLSATGDESNESQTEVVPPEPEAVERLPLNDNSEYPITQSQIDEWQRLFPAVDVDQQIRGMRAWLQANTTRRKTRKGIGRFITNWLSREQDNGGNTKRGDTGGQPRLSATERYWRQRERELAAESRH